MLSPKKAAAAAGSIAKADGKRDVVADSLKPIDSPPARPARPRRRPGGRQDRRP